MTTARSSKTIFRKPVIIRRYMMIFERNRLQHKARGASLVRREEAGSEGIFIIFESGGWSAQPWLN